MEITYASINELGKRACQEDTVGVCTYKDKALFAVADGLGGHGLGDLASQKVIQNVLRNFYEDCEPKTFFDTVFREGNAQLCMLQDMKHSPNSIKTTLACTVISDDTIFGAYMGDSRIYIFKRNKLVFQSLDHSIPQMLVSAGEMNASKIRSHPDRNRLLKVLGDRDREAVPQIIPEHYILRPVAVLLCTDGFWENVLEKEMEKTLKDAKTPEDWLDKMQKIVKRRSRWKKQDNYSAIGAWISPH